MKKLICLTSLLLLAACTAKDIATKITGAKKCLTEKAEAYVLDGTAFASPVKTTVQKMLTACVAEEQQTPETVQLAQGILTNLMKAKGNE